jgi:hypothetical protein
MNVLEMRAHPLTGNYERLVGAGDVEFAGDEGVSVCVGRSGSYEAEKDDGDEQKLESHFLYWIGEGFGKIGQI